MGGVSCQALTADLKNILNFSLLLLSVERLWVFNYGEE